MLTFQSHVTQSVEVVQINGMRISSVVSLLSHRYRASKHKHRCHSKEYFRRMHDDLATGIDDSEDNGKDISYPDPLITGCSPLLGEATRLWKI